MGPYGPMDKWHHVTCYPLAGIADVATISGFNLLTSAQQVRDSPMLCFPCCSQKSTHTYTPIHPRTPRASLPTALTTPCSLLALGDSPSWEHDLTETLCCLITAGLASRHQEQRGAAGQAGGASTIK